MKNARALFRNPFWPGSPDPPCSVHELSDLTHGARPVKTDCFLSIREKKNEEKRRRKELNKEKKRKKTDKKSRLFMMADDVSSADV